MSEGTPAAELTMILDKIARLKGLADRPGTPEEAAAAVAAIQRLMLRYNLSMAQVDGASRNEQPGIATTTYDLGGFAHTPWRHYLLHSICRYSFCRAVFAEGSGIVNIIGEHHNVAIATGLYEYLVAEVERLAGCGWRELDETKRRFSTARRWKAAFRFGAVEILQVRLREQYEAQQRGTAGEAMHALVVIKDTALDQALRSYFPGARDSALSLHAGDNAGWTAGRRAGRAINLARQIAA